MKNLHFHLVSLSLPMRWHCTLLCSSKWDRYTSQVSLSHKIWNFSLTFLTIFFFLIQNVHHIYQIYIYKMFHLFALDFCCGFSPFWFIALLLWKWREITYKWLKRIQNNNNINTEKYGKSKTSATLLNYLFIT